MGILRTRAADDDGFGLVEVVVALFILGLIAIAMLPLMIQGYKVSVEQSTIAAATQLVSETIDGARDDSPIECASLGVDRTVTDGRGVSLHVVGEVVGSCDGFVGPGTIKYRATVSSSAGVLATATTLIFVPAEEEE